MKSNAKQFTKPAGISLLEIAFLALPLLALIPNFFVVPSLNYPGLATQEVAFSFASAVFAALGLFALVRVSANSVQLSREQLLLVGSLALFILWQAISLKWSPVFYEAVRVIAIWFGFAVFFLAAMTVMRQRAALMLHYVLTAVCAVLAFSLIFERMVYGEFMLGIIFNHGITSELLAMLLPLQVLNYLCHRKTAVMAISLVVSALSMVALLIGLRRGAIIALVVMMILIGVGLAAKHIQLVDRRRLIIILAVLIVAAGVIGVRYRQAITFRIQGATQLQSVEGGLTNRLRGWITAWEMGKRNVLIGVGQSGYPAAYGEYRPFFASNPDNAAIVKGLAGEDTDEIRSPFVHNEYLQIFAELGLIGLVLFAAFWLLLGWRLWQLGRAGGESAYWIWGVWLGMLTFSISSVFSSFSFRYTPSVFVFACLVAVGFGFAKDSAGNTTVKEGFALPKVVALAAAAVAVILSLAFTARAYNVYASQLLQGQATLQTEALDFTFYPDKPADNDRLERRYKQVLELDSENIGAHLGYGLLLFQMKRPAEAIPHLEIGLNGGYSRSFGYVALAFAHEQAGNLSRATQLMKHCLAAYPESIVGRAVYAELLRKEGRSAEANEQDAYMRSHKSFDHASWTLALSTKAENAVAEAKTRGLVPLDQLKPQLAARLVFWRSFHYLK
ncbi:MAG: O-antigen ligase family protein [Acidobacteriota bacterium]|nr:O-antigen ligase family protein [Acidobacteriota bacterium]